MSRCCNMPSVGQLFKSTARLLHDASIQSLNRTYICIVTPQVRRSLTRRTLLMTSRPRSSNTKTFHIGSPSAFSIGAEGATMPSRLFGSCRPSAGAGVVFRFKILSIEARVSHQHLVLCTRFGGALTYLAVPKRLMSRCHIYSEGLGVAQANWFKVLRVIHMDSVFPIRVLAFP